jgi:hypothetical protein
MDVSRKEPEYVLSQQEGLENSCFKKVSLCIYLNEEGQGFCSCCLSASAYASRQNYQNSNEMTFERKIPIQLPHLKGELTCVKKKDELETDVVSGIKFEGL